MERNLHADIARGVRAEHELTETEGAFEAVRAAILRELVNTSPSHPEKVLKLHLAVQNLDAVQTALKKTIAAGAHAQAARNALAEVGLTKP